MSMEAQRDDVTRISIDKLQDWERVRAHFTDAAMQVLDKELAAAPNVNRQLLLAHVQKFVDRTFDMTRPNLRINGRNFEEMDPAEQDEEPFDEGFDRHIWSLSEQALKWDKELAEKRRERPGEVERLVQELLENQRAADEAYCQEDEDMDVDAATQDDIPESTYENAENVSRQVYANTEELNQTVPVQLERAERVRTVATEIKALKL